MGQCASVECDCELEEKQLVAMQAMGNHLESQMLHGHHIPSITITAAIILGVETGLYGLYYLYKRYRHRHDHNYGLDHKARMDEERRAHEREQAEERRTHEREQAEAFEARAEERETRRQIIERAREEKLANQLASMESIIQICTDKPQILYAKNHRGHTSVYSTDTDGETLSPDDRRKTKAKSTSALNQNKQNTPGHKITK
jgi:hypothetical protein